MGKLFDKIRRVQDKTRPFCTAIVPAAGSSTRMGGQDKLLADLCGAPVLMRTLCAIDQTELVETAVSLLADGLMRHREVKQHVYQTATLRVRESFTPMAKR